MKVRVYRCDVCDLPNCPWLDVRMEEDEYKDYLDKIGSYIEISFVNQLEEMVNEER